MALKKDFYSHVPLLPHKTELSQNKQLKKDDKMKKKHAIYFCG